MWNESNVRYNCPALDIQARDTNELRIARCLFEEACSILNYTMVQMRTNKKGVPDIGHIVIV